MPLKSHSVVGMAASRETSVIALITSFALGSLCGWIAKASLPSMHSDICDKMRLYADIPSNKEQYKRTRTIEACVSDVESALEAVRAGVNSWNYA